VVCGAGDVVILLTCILPARACARARAAHIRARAAALSFTARTPLPAHAAAALPDTVAVPVLCTTCNARSLLILPPPLDAGSFELFNQVIALRIDKSCRLIFVFVGARFTVAS
jgi:hypothetical protein